eukprot:823262-Rhodomonas_salina.1
MEEGTNYEQSFAPVPCSTAGRTVIALAAGNGLHLHAMDITQAFIQANWANLPEDIGKVYISPPPGVDKNTGIVYKVLRPLYGHVASA